MTKARFTLLIAPIILLATAPAQALEVETLFSSDFSKDLADTYGEREGEFLAQRIERHFSEAVSDTDLNIDRIVVTIEDAKPNRPTFKQSADQPSLDIFASRSIGGAKLTAVALDANGSEIGRISGKWYETDLENSFAAGTWSDANRAIRIVSRRFAKTLQ